MNPLVSRVRSCPVCESQACGCTEEQSQNPRSHNYHDPFPDADATLTSVMHFRDLILKAAGQAGVCKRRKLTAEQEVLIGQTEQLLRDAYYSLKQLQSDLVNAKYDAQYNHPRPAR